LINGRKGGKKRRNHARKVSACTFSDFGEKGGREWGGKEEVWVDKTKGAITHGTQFRILVVLNLLLRVRERGKKEKREGEGRNRRFITESFSYEGKEK